MTMGTGTVFYMSPEQSMGTHYNKKTDVFSLGIIILEIFCKFNTQSEKALYTEKLWKEQEFSEEFLKKKNMNSNIYQLIW